MFIELINKGLPKKSAILLNSIFMKKLGVLILSISFISCNQFKTSVINDFASVNQDSVVNIKGRLDNIRGNVITLNVPVFDYNSKIEGKIDDVFDSIYTIRLETLDSCIIGNIDQLEIVNDTIYIRDQYMTRNICMFDMNGKFVRKIGKMGQGPLEYIEPSDMHVTANAIIVYDQWQHKLIKYRHNGFYVSENILPFMCTQIMELDNGEFVFLGINADNFHLPQILNYKFWKTDASFRVNKVGLYCKHNVFPTSYDNKLFRNSIGEYYYDYVSDTVFFFDSVGNMFPKYKMNFKKNHSKDILRSGIKNYVKASNDGEYISIRKFFALKNYIICAMATGHRTTNIFYNLKTNNITYFNANTIYKSNISRLLPYTTPLGIYKNDIVFCISPSDLLNGYEHFVAKQEDYWQGPPQWVIDNDHKLIEGLNEEDNPILVFGRLKKEFYE